MAAAKAADGGSFAMGTNVAPRRLHVVLPWVAKPAEAVLIAETRALAAINCTHATC